MCAELYHKAKVGGDSIDGVQAFIEHAGAGMAADAGYIGLQGGIGKQVGRLHQTIGAI